MAEHVIAITISGKLKCRLLRQHRRKDGVPTILLLTKIEYHRWVISHKKYLILPGELGKTLSTTYLLMRFLAVGLPARRTIKISGTAWCVSFMTRCVNIDFHGRLLEGLE